MKKWGIVIQIISTLLIIAMTFGLTVSMAGATDPAEQIQQRGTKILNAFLWFGYAIALGMIVFIGIKYMLGAADAKANMKSTLISWLVGALIVFMATTIVGWVLGATGTKDSSADDLANQIVQKAQEINSTN